MQLSGKGETGYGYGGGGKGRDGPRRGFRADPGTTAEPGTFVDAAHSRHAGGGPVAEAGAARPFGSAVDGGGGGRGLLESGHDLCGRHRLRARGGEGAAALAGLVGYLVFQ